MISFVLLVVVVAGVEVKGLPPFVVKLPQEVAQRVRGRFCLAQNLVPIAPDFAIGIVANPRTDERKEILFCIAVAVHGDIERFADILNLVVVSFDEIVVHDELHPLGAHAHMSAVETSLLHFSNPPS